MKQIALKIAPLLFLSACASGGFGVMDRVMSSWNGASVDEVIGQWGYPHEERRIAGRTLLVWHRGGQLVMPTTTTGTATRIGTTTYITAQSTGGPIDYNCSRILEVKDNKVAGWQWEGNNCPFAAVGPYANWPRKQ